MKCIISRITYRCVVLVWGDIQEKRKLQLVEEWVALSEQKKALYWQIW